MSLGSERDSFLTGLWLALVVGDATLCSFFRPSFEVRTCSTALLVFFRRVKYPDFLQP